MYLPIRTSDISRKPSVARPCLTVMPCGSLTTGFGVTMTLAIMGGGSAGIAKSCLVPRFRWKQRLADQALVCGEIPLTSLRHDIVGQARRLRFLVPAGTRQPVAHELFVVRIRRDAYLIAGRIPVSRAVGRQGLIDEDEVVAEQTELEFRIRQDQAATRGHFRSELVELQACVA